MTDDRELTPFEDEVNERIGRLLMELARLPSVVKQPEGYHACNFYYADDTTRATFAVSLVVGVSKSKEHYIVRKMTDMAGSFAEGMSESPLPTDQESE